MPHFSWFLPGKARKKERKGGTLFAEFQASLEELKKVDQYIMAVLEETADEAQIRADLKTAVDSAVARFSEFEQRWEGYRADLVEYVKTSVSEHDYVAEVESLNDVIAAHLASLAPAVLKEDFEEALGLVESKTKSLIAKVAELEEQMLLFRDEAKGSLAWNLDTSAKNIPLADLRSKVRALGGKIDPSKGKGEHFGIVFKLFEMVGSGKRTHGCRDFARRFRKE